ncbi:MAG: prepilin peptidase [Verrucomicrobia bacterium]|nr:prepilin peptidase [Verrucomicrobiota bacterium]
MFDPQPWAAAPFHFWSVVFFVLGSMVGSLLNVCIHRMPRDESIVSPGSHCPHCGYAIPWFLNIPLLTWLYLRGKCANCAAPISFRYFLVELLTGVTFLGAWLAHGAQSPLLALAYCLVLSGFLAATFIDFEHFIIPDQITLGGIAVGFVCSAIVPALHADLFTGAVPSAALALRRSFLGILVGGGLIYLILRIGKILFGRQRFALEPNTKVVFTETALHLPGQEIAYGDVFYRKSDAIAFEAKSIELTDRCYTHVDVRLTPSHLWVGDDKFNPEEIPRMDAVTDQIVLPREAMGLGDVKFMAAIGAFLGWQAVIFSLMLSAMIGAFAGLLLVALRKQAWSSRLPYGPYIALAATLWIFAGHPIVHWWFNVLNPWLARQLQGLLGFAV